MTTNKQAQSQKLEFGVGRRCINPEMPISLAGYFNVRWWDRVLDDIEVRVLVLKFADVYAGLVQLDLVNIPAALAEDIHAAVAAAGIRELHPENMILTTTHSHTAPEVRSGKPGFDERYPRFVAQKTAEALQDALGSMRYGSLARGLASDDRFIFNRRYWMKNGEVVTNPGKLNPDIDRMEGEIDPEIPLLAIKEDGRIAVLLANIVNHADTIGGHGVSADWPGFLHRRLEKQFGAGSMVMPLVGAAGNINHFDVRVDSDQTCYGEAERIGNGYAETIERALASLEPVDDCTLKTYSRHVVVPPREISVGEVAEARRVLDELKDVPDAANGGTLTSEDLARKSPVALKYFAQSTVKMAELKDPVDFLVTGIFIGTACLLALPAEPFVEIGLELRKKIFADRLAMVLENCNSSGHARISGGYIPNKWNYGRGGYETTPLSNPYSVHTSEKLLDAWREIASQTSV